MKYEMIREFFTYCDNSRTRQVALSELETDDPDTDVKKMMDADGGELSCFVAPDGSRTYDIITGGAPQRITLNPES